MDQRNTKGHTPPQNICDSTPVPLKQIVLIKGYL